jgi:Fic family protein
VERALESIALADKTEDNRWKAVVLACREAFSSFAIDGLALKREEEMDHQKGRIYCQIAAQIYDYEVALRELVPVCREAGSKVFRHDFVCEIHRCLARAAPSQAGAGALRKNVTWIGGGADISLSEYNPPSPVDVPGCFEQTLCYMRDMGPQRATQDVIVRMAVAHAHLEAVHPFEFGNGRLGRLLVPLMLAAEGHRDLYLSCFLERRTATYFSALRSAQLRLDYAPLIELFAEAIIDAASSQWLQRQPLLEPARWDAA